MMSDFRKFSVGMYQKLNPEFIIFKDNFPMRLESITFIHLFLKHSNNNGVLFDELVKNIKKHHLIQQELMVIKNSIKGPKVHSVFYFIHASLANNNQEIINILVRLY
jgi:hypothetical protein